jgi:quinol monooxygenase YgiN
MSIDLVVNFQASEGNDQDLLQLLTEGRDISRAAKGCEAFELFQRPRRVVERIVTLAMSISHDDQGLSAPVVADHKG